MIARSTRIDHGGEAHDRSIGKAASAQAGVAQPLRNAEELVVTFVSPGGASDASTRGKICGAADHQREARAMNPTIIVLDRQAGRRYDHRQRTPCQQARGRVPHA